MIVSTNIEFFTKESIESLEDKLVGLWHVLIQKGIDKVQLLSRSLISPETYCLVNPDGEKTVEKAFGVTRELSPRLKDRVGIN